MSSRCLLIPVLVLIAQSLREVASAATPGQNINQTSVPTLVKFHGIAMSVGWGLVAPVGISIGLMYKSVWPGKGWFIAHLVTMLTALAINVLGIILILAHANGVWLQTQVLNLPHQIAGIVAITALGVNPLVAIFKPDPESIWRGLFNVIHGSIGVFTGLITAMCAMLLGVHMFPILTNTSPDTHRNTTLTMSALAGYTIVIVALYNIYPLRYHKSVPDPYSVISLTKSVRAAEREATFAPHNATSNEDDEDDDINLSSSPDYICRLVTSAFSLVPLIGLGMTVIILIATS